MIIDGHAHLFHPRWYPASFVAALTRGMENGSPRARKLLEQLSDDSGEKTLRAMDAAAIDHRVILIVDWGLTLEEPVASIFEIHQEVLQICSRHRGRLAGFAGVDPRRKEAVELLRWAFDELGAQGLKLHRSASWSLADDSTRAAVATAAERGLPVVVHMGESPRPLSGLRASTSELVGLARHFPEIPIVAAHGGFAQWREFASTEVPENVYFDVSGWQARLADATLSAEGDLLPFVRRFSSRIFFGTDNPFFSNNLPYLEAKWPANLRAYLHSEGEQVCQSVLAHSLLRGLFETMQGRDVDADRSTTARHRDS